VRVEHLVDALEPEVRHPDEIEVRVSERDPEAAHPLHRPEGYLGLPQELVPFSKAS
jgi:hypothetical protein